MEGSDVKHNIFSDKIHDLNGGFIPFICNVKHNILM